MKILHTSDWHVGKKIRGHSRATEHEAVLAEITQIAATENVDIVAVAGDLYETSAPSAESEKIVNNALLGLAEVAPVVAIAGNHDNARRLEAVAPLMGLGRITMRSKIAKPENGGRVILKTETGEEVDVAFLPFVSQRSIVRVDDLMTQAAFQNAQTYADRMQRVLQSLCVDFSADRVNLVVGHAFVHGGNAGGGERAAHLVDEYGLSAVDFPATASYVALGHLHRPQQMLGATAIHYCGSPLQLDFSEGDQIKQVNVVDVSPGLPAKVRSVALTSGRTLRTLTGTVADLATQMSAAPDGFDNAWFRVRVTEPNRAGLADEVRSIVGPNVVDVRVETPDVAVTPRRSTSGRSASELFGDYLGERNIDDPKLVVRFNEFREEADDDPLNEKTPTSNITPGQR